MSALLSIRNLQVHFKIRAGTARAVDGLDLELAPGEKLGLVGESGSGKTTTALAVMRMIRPPGVIVDGSSIVLDDRQLLDLSETEMRQVRGKDIAMVPQAAMNALNPVRRIGDQIRDGLVDHGVRESRSAIYDRMVTLLDQVGLAENVLSLYPHELSGGMKQTCHDSDGDFTPSETHPGRRADERVGCSGATAGYGDARRCTHRHRRRGDLGRA